jgi:hypothetical protein
VVGIHVAVRMDLPHLYPVKQIASIVHRLLSWKNVTINSPRINRTAAGVKKEEIGNRIQCQRVKCKVDKYKCIIRFDPGTSAMSMEVTSFSETWCQPLLPNNVKTHATTI